MKHPTEQSYHDHTTLRQVVKNLKNKGQTIGVLKNRRKKEEK